MAEFRGNLQGWLIQAASAAQTLEVVVVAPDEQQARGIFQAAATAGHLPFPNLEITAIAPVTILDHGLLQAQEAEARYTRLVELLPDGVGVHQDGIIRMVNPAGARLLGYGSPAELVGQPFLSIVHPDDHALVRERVQAQLQRGEVVPPTVEHFLRQDGSVVVTEVAAGPFALGGRPAALVVVRDITARLRLDDQMRQAQRLEALGRLAGGIAHDFNNFLTAIVGYADLIRQTLPADAPVLPDADALLHTASRACDLTRQLLAFSRRQPMTTAVLSLPDLVSKMLGILTRLIGEDVAVTFQADPDVGYVRADSAQIEQVIMNLVINGREAMPHGGQLALTLSRCTTALTVDSQPPLPAGDYVVLTVRDTGTGMPPEVRTRLFEPFFTTKEGGTGLGLATIYGIIQQAGGGIQVESAVGAGTAFHVFLPRTAELPRPAPDFSAVGCVPGTETILVVEDNDLVRTLAVRILRTSGYTVLEAASGGEALRITLQGGPLHLVLTDVVLPDIAGPVLLETLRKHHPHILVLYMSGYDQTTPAHTLPGGQPFIAKPFTPAALTQRIRTLLDGSA